MRKNKTLTTSVNPRIIATLSMFSKKYNTPKNKIIEMALSRYFKAVKRTELKETFNAAKRDKQIKAFTNFASGNLTKVLSKKK